MRPNRDTVLASCRIALGAVFVFAVTSKLTQFEVLPVGPASGLRVFAYVLERNGLLPAEYCWPAAVVVAVLEAVVGMWLLSARQVYGAALAACALLAVFTLYLVAALLHQGTAACNCFGTMQPTDVRIAVARNTGLFLMGIVVMRCGVQQSRSQSRFAPAGRPPRTPDRPKPRQA